MSTCNNSLTNKDIQRYSRQLIIPEFGVDGKKFFFQKKTHLTMFILTILS
jgi:molybdopterin/thiamine biosynthesis adenylyltransferase